MSIRWFTLISLFSVVLAVSSAAAESVAPVSPPKGFEEEGLEVSLSKEQLELLKPWAENTQAKLRDLLINTRGMSSNKARDALLEETKRIVIESAPKQTELLIRYTLNRALKVNGMIKEEARGRWIWGDRVADLEVWLLRRAIELSLRYYKDDLSAVVNGGPINHPFAEYGVEFAHMLMNSDQSVFAAQSQYKIALFVLQLLHWDLYRDVPRRAQLTPVIVQLANFLKTMKQDPPANDKRAVLDLKKIRREYERALDGIKAVLGAEKYDALIKGVECLFVSPDSIPDYSKFKLIKTTGLLVNDRPPVAIAVSKDSKYVAVAYRPRNIRIYSLSTGAFWEAFETSYEIDAIAFSSKRPDKVIYVAETGMIVDLEARFGTWQSESQVLREPFDGMSSRVATGGDKYVQNLSNGNVTLFDLETGRRLYTMSVWGAKQVSVRADGEQLALIPSHGSGVQVWNADTNEIDGVIRDRAYSVTYSPNGKYILTASSGSVANVYESRGLDRIRSLRHDSDVQAMTFSSDSRLAVTVTLGQTYVWSIETGALLALLPGGYHAVAVSSDGKRIVTSDRDGRVLIWGMHSCRVQ